MPSRTFISTSAFRTLEILLAVGVCHHNCLSAADVLVKVCPTTTTSLLILLKALPLSQTASSRHQTNESILLLKAFLYPQPPIALQHPMSWSRRPRAMPISFERSTSRAHYSMGPRKATPHCTPICVNSRGKTCIQTCRMLRAPR